MSNGFVKSRLDSMISHRKVSLSFSRKHVDYSETVKSFYIEDDLAYISCNVRKFSDVIDSYSVREYAWPNREFIQFVEANACNIPAEYPIALELCGTHFTTAQQEAISKALANYYSLRLGDSQQDVMSNRLKSLVLFGLTVLSAATLVAYWMLSSGKGLIEEILLIGFWFFLWEWGDVVAFERGNVNKKHQAAAQLASVSIIFNERFVDEPVKDDVKEEILENIMANAAMAVVNGTELSHENAAFVSENAASVRGCRVKGSAAKGRTDECRENSGKAYGRRREYHDRIAAMQRNHTPIVPA